MNQKLTRIFLCILILSSCQNREWSNPFDPNCPKEIWTPTDFKAVQEGTTIKLTWNQSVTQISGFKVTKSVDGGTNTSLPDLAKGINQSVDNTLIGGKNHSYSLTAYAGNNSSNTVTVHITPVLTALVVTTAVSTITTSSIISGGNITSDGGANITARGVCWSTKQNPTISDSKTSDGTGDGIYNSSITGLNSGVTYYIRAYATNGQGTSYGNQVTASTVANLAVITTSTVSAISTSGALSGGNITNDGGGAITARGVYWFTPGTPPAPIGHTTDGSGNGAFASTITGLSTNTTYYVSAYATNSAGTAFGNQISFTTLGIQITPTFATIGPLCQNSSPPALPLSSTNTPAITGTWNPATINSINVGTTSYTFTPSAGQNASTTTFSIKINAVVTPTFAVIGPFCLNNTAPALPSTSTNGITGTWNPALISTATMGTRTLTFTPSSGQCASVATIDYTVTSNITPTFAVIGPLCQNSTAPTLASASTNGISGTWSPATISTATSGTTTYTFTPNAGQCATSVTLGIMITNSITPAFSAIGPLNQTSTPPLLPLTSTNGITGSWSPSTISTSLTGTITYTFSPNAGQCATAATIDIVTTPLTVTDIDGNIYHIVTIGTQVWMVENLKTTKYNDGTPIPNITDNTTWYGRYSAAAYCWYNNDLATYKPAYGALYNWSAVNTGKLAPQGWHVPTDLEWSTLTSYLGGEAIAGGKLKEIGKTYWVNFNIGATNETGFSGLPGGNRNGDGTFTGIGNGGLFWSSTWDAISSKIWYRELLGQNAAVLRNSLDLRIFGLSVRCVKD